MNKIEIKTVLGYEGPAVEYRGDDGWPVGHIIPAVAAVALDGREFSLPNRFWTVYDEDGFGPYPRTRYDLTKAREIADEVTKRGYIDADHWVEVDPPLSREQRERADVEREHAERHGYRCCD